MSLKPKMGPFRDPEKQYRPLGVLFLAALFGAVVIFLDIGDILVSIAN